MSTGVPPTLAEALRQRISSRIREEGLSRQRSNEPTPLTEAEQRGWLLGMQYAERLARDASTDGLSYVVPVVAQDETDELGEAIAASTAFLAAKKRGRGNGVALMEALDAVREFRDSQ